MNEILKKFIAGQCSKEEFDQAVSILKGEKEKSALNDFMRYHWNQVDINQRNGIKIKLDKTLDSIHHQINLKEEGRTLYQQFAHVFSRVAAILLLPLMVAMTYLILQNVRPDEAEVLTTLTIPMGASGKVDLPDGSVAWLNAGSRLVYPSSFKRKKERVVELDGEGYFEVEKNASQPFYVRVQDITVKVLGTTFNVSAYPKDPILTVALVEGSVHLFKDEEQEALATLVPNQVGSYQRKDHQLTVSNEKSLNSFVAWKEGKLLFENEPLEQVLLKVSRKYNVDYVMEDKELLDYHITGTFMYETLEEFLMVIRLTSPIEYRIVSGEIGKDGIKGKKIIHLKKIK